MLVSIVSTFHRHNICSIHVWIIWLKIFCCLCFLNNLWHMRKDCFRLRCLWPNAI